MILSRVNEIIERAKKYIKKYNISPLNAVKHAMKDISKELEEDEKY